MKVLFIYPDISTSITCYRGSISFGLISISALLKSRGIHAELFHITNKYIRRDEFLSRVKQASCELLAFSANSSMFKYVITYAQWAKEEFRDLPILCGGIHPTVAPEHAISVKYIDMICLGEGEETMLELCQYMETGKDIRQVKNLWIKYNSKLYKNIMRPLIKNLDELPFYDWELFDLKSLDDSQEGVGNYLASRGCLYNCSYCANHQIKNLYSHEKSIVRFQSVPRVIEEIKRLLALYPFIKYIVFQDDILAKNKKWFQEFAEAFRTHINKPYMCNARPELTTEPIAELMKRSGCSRAWVGVESGNEEIRKKVLKRNISQEQLKRTFCLLRTHGIATHSFNMVGIPYEDSKKILETIKLNAELRPTGLQATIFYPYPNSELYELCLKEGYLSDRSADDYHTCSILRLPTISSAEIEFFKRYFRILVKMYRMLNILPLPGKKYLIIFIDRIFTWRFFPYRLFTQLYNLPLKPAKYLHARFFRKLYKRRARQFH